MATSLEKSIGVIGIGVGGAALGTALGYYAASRRNKKKRKSKRKLKNKARRKRNRMYRAKQRQPYTAGKRKDRSHRRIRFTKNNQPYVIMANGRARFISKRSLSSSRKRKGGKY